MDSNGIGTDATIHEHIKTIQDREYCKKVGQEFKPTFVGVALVEAYQQVKLDLYKPFLRAEMERDMTKIAQGERPYSEVLSQEIWEMKEIFNQTSRKIQQMKEALV